LGFGVGAAWSLQRLVLLQISGRCFLLHVLGLLALIRLSTLLRIGLRTGLWPWFTFGLGLGALPLLDEVIKAHVDFAVSHFRKVDKDEDRRSCCLSGEYLGTGVVA